MALLLPLLMAAASRHSHQDSGLHPVGQWRRRVEDLQRTNHQELKLWAEEGPFGSEGSGDDAASSAWREVVGSWARRPEGEREQWQEDAWRLLREWTQDDGPSSLPAGLAGLVHLTSRVSVGNTTEERVAVLPSSSLLPLLKHLATSPLFAHYAPMALPVLAPVFIIFFLMPLLIVPVLVTLFALGVVGSLSALATAGSALLPFGLGALGTLGRVGFATWMAHQDLDSLLERTGLEEEAGSGDTLTSTTVAPATAANIVLHSEVPRMLAW